uniref:T9SS type A sorting domain-containing protein n=1 Tax=candidate division WOR-3 bacterium TaxID=2052148 RepID=A0A7C3YV79_UNCW3
MIDPIPDGPRTPPRYWAYDDVDTIYRERPRFNWIEIRNRGTRLPITLDDQTIRIPLPFVFKYYGIRYTDSLSICSNGWISPIWTTSTVYSNQPLPDPTSTNPSAMICPNWDDLYPIYGNGIWYLYQPDSHRFIIEWDSVHYYSPNTQWDKFQIIVYDTTVSTYTGDNEFIFQYLTANNYISNTVGIEDETNLIGINALFNNSYHQACAPLVPGRAIKFTTDTMALVGLKEEVYRQAQTPLATINRKKVNLSLKLSSEPLVLSIYDLNGREIRRFKIPPSTPNITWDGQDERGNPVPTGIYLIRISGEGRKEKGKIIFIR